MDGIVNCGGHFFLRFEFKWVSYVVRRLCLEGALSCPIDPRDAERLRGLQLQVALYGTRNTPLSSGAVHTSEGHGHGYDREDASGYGGGV